MPMTNHFNHVFVSLTPHGYGHVAMTEPLITELRRRRPDLRLTVQTDLPEQWLRSRIDGSFGLVRDTADFGARMVDAIRVDLPETLAAYVRLHADLDGLVAREAKRLQDLDVDLVISNISYVALAAAHTAGVPAVGLGCFTWADILAGCAPGNGEAERIVGEMMVCYAKADVILRTEPAMAMHGLDNVHTIGPMAQRRQRRDVRALLGVGQGEGIGLIGFGGIGLDMPLSDWPRVPGWHWLTSEPGLGRPDMSRWEDTGLSFSDVLASSDVVVTKPGYGTFTECAVNGIPVLTLPRPDWPETPALLGWLEEQGRAVVVSPEELFSPRLEEQLHRLFSLPAKPLPSPTGATAAADTVDEVLVRHRPNVHGS